MRQDEKYQRGLERAAKLSGVVDVILHLALLVILGWIALLLADWIVPKITPTNRTAADYCFLVIVGEVFGALIVVPFKMARRAKCSGELGAKRQIMIRLVGAIVLEVLLLGGALAVFWEAQRYAAMIVQYGLDPAIADTRYWISITLIYGLAAGHLGGMGIIPND